MADTSMGPLAIGVLAFGLAADATAVAVTRGMAMRRVRARDALRVGVVFGLFQAGMPLIGWALGEAFGELIAAVDHWIAFGILGVLGARMIWGALHGEDDADERAPSGRLLLVLAVATSIDALAAGITLPLMGAPLWSSILTIGLVTMALSSAGMVLGRRLGERFAGRITVIGGVVLIGLGTKILVEHLMNGT